MNKSSKTPNRNESNFFLDITTEVCPMTFVRTRLKIEQMSPGDVVEVRLKGAETLKRTGKGIKSLAKQIIEKSFKPKLIPKMNDEEAIIYLSNLRQIGRWSAEMILLFTYNRSNIWPVQDIGLLRAISKNYNKKYLPPEKFVNNLKKNFSPYCSVATWYLWRSIDPEPIQY